MKILNLALLIILSLQSQISFSTPLDQDLTVFNFDKSNKSCGLSREEAYDLFDDDILAELAFSHKLNLEILKKYIHVLGENAFAIDACKMNLSTLQLECFKDALGSSEGALELVRQGFKIDDLNEPRSPKHKLANELSEQYLVMDFAETRNLMRARNQFNYN